LFDLHSIHSRDIDEVWGTPLMRLRRAPLRTVMWRIKRVVDIVVAALALLILAPCLAAIAGLVRWRMGSPVLFRQRRVGIDNEEFTILKFRSLPNASDEVTDTDWAAEHRRPGRLGAFLRATSLDELPQLWNVLVGDMSLVGPRPEREHFVREFAGLFDSYDHRHRVHAGLTGLAQVHGLRGDTSIDERARFDNAYVERWTLGTDIKIMLRTAVAALRWRGR
jgi:lipopolysaccharide/colanic/teichoic acid biosynthesis glycosyltransferase